MWKLMKIEATNLCAFQQLIYTPLQGVTTLVFGDNRDNENQRSNGSGKSALIEGIALGITGGPLRKIRNEEIINDNADECSVRLCFANDCSDEEFTVNRSLLRKGGSSVSCSIIRNGKRVTTDEAVCSSVDAYNRYILDKLGITKDELFNNFILSRHKYQDFLSCPDKDKKDIINRFSNGNLVDQAIQKIIEDIIPLQNDMNAAAMEMAGIDGRIQILNEQIEQEENSKEERKRTKAEKIDGMLQSIAEKRNLVRVKQTQIATLEEKEKQIKDADNQAQDLENSETCLEDCLPKVQELIIPLIAPGITDWDQVIKAKKQEISEAEKQLAEWDETIAGIDSRIKVCATQNVALTNEHKDFTSKYTEKQQGLNRELQTIAEKVTVTSSKLESLRINRRRLSGAIENLKGKLAGTISCPSCGHEFLLADENFSVSLAKGELENKVTELSTVQDSIAQEEECLENAEQSRSAIQKQSRSLSSAKEEWDTRLSKSKRDLQAIEYELENAKNGQRRIADFISNKQKEVEDIRRKIFDEVFDLIDNSLKSIERAKKGLLEEINTAENSVLTLQQTINELNQSTGNEMLDSLKKSLKSARQQSSAVLSKKEAAEEKHNQLAEQQQHFVMFKTYLANSKIEALNRMTNEILEDIGSDIRIRLSGYTVLKSGNIREKISVSLLRDGVDCGSFGKFSEGEKARVNLATIIAMQKLVNGNCATDKGFDLLVIDELLDSFDEAGLACTFSALNKLGVTALVVSHGHTSESYPYKITIVKEHGISAIKE